MDLEPGAVKYISYSNSNKNEFMLFNKVPVLITDPLTNNIQFQNVINRLEKNIPEHLFYEIDTIIIGQFSELIQRDVKSVYTDGAIYATNEQKSEDDLYDDIVHEIAHSLEKPYGLELYGDDKLELEYLGKRQRLLDILRSRGYTIGYDLDRVPDYVQEFDEFLYFDLGFDNLRSFTRGLFVTPYSATSLSEYFSEGFEHYLLHDPTYLQKISPVLYDKVKYLADPETEE
jgi:hypothetical protein|tara:strand:+ start:221 stop:910 length:690 start_codon:yes stop_codon:yes gene_type:complete